MKVTTNKEFTPNLLDLRYGQTLGFTGSGPACPRAEDYLPRQTLGRPLPCVLPHSLHSQISPVVVPWDSRRTER